MPDREKGSGRWISRGAAGGDPNAAARVKDALADESPQPRGERAKKAIRTNAAFVRTLLKDHAADVIHATNGGQPLHEDDAAELAAKFDKELSAVPTRFQAELKEIGQRMRDFISSGDRGPAWVLADETAVRMGAELPTTFSPPEPDNSDLDAIIAAVPR